MIQAVEQLLASDAQRDAAVCGCSLAAPGRTRFAGQAAHDPAPTPYFVLEELLGGLGLGPSDHLLDVGCGTGRVLAYAQDAGLPCRVTGVELDPDLAAVAAAWSASYERLDVVPGSVLDLPLAPYTHFYLFNPFDTPVLEAFLDKVEREAAASVTVVHMSDNGEWPAYLGRRGWKRVREGMFQGYPPQAGPGTTLGDGCRRASMPEEGCIEGPACAFDVFDCPQHYSVWRFSPA